MKKFLFFFAAFFLFLPTSYAQSALNPPDQKDFSIFEEVTLNGNGFGLLDAASSICFNKITACFVNGSQGIKAWNDLQITFFMPKDIDRDGMIQVRNANGLVGEFPYHLNSTILEINNGNLPVLESSPGQTLFFEGSLFGNTAGTVQFGIVNAEIVQWKDTEIVVKVPEVNIDTPTVKICFSSLNCLEKPFIVRKQVFKDPFSYYQQYLRTIHYDKAFDILKPQKDIIVAVIDSGVYLKHPELENKIWNNSAEKPGDAIDNDKNGYIDDVSGFNFIDNNNVMTVKSDHGTSVAGIIAAERNNNQGISGIATNVKIMPLIVCDELSCPLSAINKAIMYAVDNGARVLNISIGTQLFDGFTPGYNDAVRYAYEKGAVIVVAAGNGNEQTDDWNGQDLNKNPESPVCNDNNGNMVLGVGATTLDGTAKAYWSNYGSNCVDIYAPGENIATLKAEGNFLYDLQDGTSFSAPIIAGLAAQVLSARPNMRNSTLYTYFIKDVNATTGLIDAEKLFQDIVSNYKDEGVFIAVPSVKPSTTIMKTDYSSLQYFSDVPKTSKNLLAINYLRNKNVIIGFPEGTFKPYQSVTRAELLKILIKGGLQIEPEAQYKKACFKDVKIEDWFSNYVCYAKEKGWAEGYQNGNFEPNKPINKVEALKFLVVINNLSNAKSTLLPFTDAAQGSWYENYLKIAFAKGLLEQIGNTYGVQKDMTRGEISENIFRLSILKSLGKDLFTQDLLQLI